MIKYLDHQPGRYYVAKLDLIENPSALTTPPRSMQIVLAKCKLLITARKLGWAVDNVSDV